MTGSRQETTLLRYGAFPRGGGPLLARTAGVVAIALCLVTVPAGPGDAVGAPPKETKAGEKKGGKKGASKKKGVKKGGKKKDGPDRVIVWLRIGKVVKGGVKITVQPFQRLQDIAKAYGVGTGDILKANPSVSANMIKSGQKLLVPGATSVKAVKTYVPADKLDQLEGVGIQMKGALSSKEGGKSKKKKKKDGGKDLIKSGVVVAKGVMHTVQQKQTIHIIAEAYGITANKILKANNVKDKDVIQPGQKILVPGVKKVVGVWGVETVGGGVAGSNAVKSGKVVKAGVLHTVMPGQTLWDISKAYKTKINNILKVNGLKNQNKIKAGMKILIPEAKKVVAVPCSKKSSMMYVHPITFHRIHTGETRNLNLFTPAGKINWKQYKIFKKMMFDHRANKQHNINTRLVYLLGKVAQHFNFKTIIIYSGFRAHDKSQHTRESKHNVGRAIDFAMEGVSNWTLMKYCRTFSNVGVGYYPKSYFIHLDVREKPAFWIDYSGPGKKPKYGKKKKGIEKKAIKGSIPSTGGVDHEAESDAMDVDIPNPKGKSK